MADIKDRVKGAIDTGADKARNLADQVAGAAKDATERVGNSSGQQGSGFIDKVQDNAQSAMHAVGDFANRAGDRIGDYAGKVEHWAEDAYHHAGEYAKDFGTEVTSLIRRYPVQALLVGFGVGLLLGRVVRA